MTAPVYRRNAGIVVCNKKHQVLVCNRIDIKDAWQFPQGGIEKGETVEQAARRELREETSLADVKHIVSLEKPARYTFPPEVSASLRKRGINNAGQDVYWSLFLFEGSDSEINLKTAEPEFISFKWVDLQTAYDLCVGFKKPVYAMAVKEFAQLIKECE